MLPVVSSTNTTSTRFAPIGRHDGRGGGGVPAALPRIVG